MSQQFFYSMVMLTLLLGWPLFAVAMACIASIPRSLPLNPGSGRRHYWILIPALNEAKVIRRTVLAALALHSEAAPVRVLVVDDGSDDETPEVLRDLDRELDHDRLFVVRRDPPVARQGKGAALNAGYRTIRAWAMIENQVDSTVVGVIDGDGRAAAHTIRDIVDAYFADPDVGALQCRVRIKNRQRLLGLLQDIEFSCVANASQSFRDLVDSVGMGGNGQFVRLRDLMRLGEWPWSSCLVEDLDLGLRLHLVGVRIRYSATAVIDQQAIVKLPPLLRQRARWAQGNLQCAHYLPPLFRSRRVRVLGLLDILAYLIGPWLAVPMSLVVATVISIVIAGLATGNTLGGLIATGPDVPTAVGAWIVMIFLPGLIWGLWHRWRIGDEPLSRCLVAGLCYPFFLMLGVLATWRGMLRHLLKRETWAKTERIGDNEPTHGPYPPREPSHPARAR